MRAAVLTTPGEAPAPAEHPAPEPAGRTLVRMTAAPIVPLDLLCASGTSYFGRPATPYVPGTQGVGVVEQSATLAVKAGGLIGLGERANRPVEILAERDTDPPFVDALLRLLARVADVGIGMDLGHERAAPVALGDRCTRQLEWQQGGLE